MPVLGVQREYLGAALDEIANRFRTTEAYFGEGLGIDAGTQEGLRTALVERDA